MAKRHDVPDWFGCGRTITQESWDGFLAAQRAYYERKDREAAAKQTNARPLPSPEDRERTT